MKNTSKSTISIKPEDNPKLVITHSHLQETPCILCTPLVNESIDGQEFYELMQTYRHMPLTEQEKTVEAFEAVKTYINTLLSTARQEADKQYSKKVYIAISEEIIKTLELIKKSKEEKIEFPYADYMNRIETLKDIQKILDSLTSKGGTNGL